MLKKGKTVGLALEERSILAAEVRFEKEHYNVKGTAEFNFPEDISYNNPEALGKSLGQFLRENKLSSKKAVIGIPAKWLIIREKVIPPSSEDMLAGILKIQAEQEFSLELDDLAIDYTGEASPDKSSSFLLVAMLRKTMVRIIRMAQAAGLNTISVTVTSLALTTAFRTRMLPDQCRYTLYLRPGYAEFIAKNGNSHIAVKHFKLSFDADGVSETGALGFAKDVLRFVSILPNGFGASESEKLLVWDAAGFDKGMLELFAKALSPELEIVNGREYSVIDMSAFQGEAERSRFASAAAVGNIASRAERSSIDFLNSRMNVMQKVDRGRQILWAAAVCAVLIVLGSWLFFDWQEEKAEVAMLKERLEGMSEDIQAAEDVVKKVSMARGWYTGRQNVLACFRALTMAFPLEGSIWATNLALNEDMRGIVSGKATDEKSIIDTLDKLKENSSFSNVQMLYMRDNGRNSQEVSFAVNFAFTHRE